MRDIGKIEFPDWMSKDALIPTIMEKTPIQFVVDNSAMVRACYQEPDMDDIDKPFGWNEDRLNAMSEYDLIKILRMCMVTEDQIPDE